ncbi:hypothetical protein BGX38DRAFT_284104 [Terfezia claveryi]|nr:hypothetical protein BGX38DRAFT_284104 [Terfezia claveryi]
MLRSREFISTPTPLSPGLLTRVLSVYPTLRPILLYSHRADIIHLARTCRTLNVIVKDSISPLCAPFPRCTSALEPCHWCRAIVCTTCKFQGQRHHCPVVWGYNGDAINRNEAIVIRPESSTNFVHEVLSDKRQHRNTFRALQMVHNTAVCASCFRAYQGTMSSQSRARMWQFDIEELHWDELPNTHIMCKCTPNTQAECEGDKRLMEFGDIPPKYMLRALVKLPEELRQTPTSKFVALYVC